MELTYGELSSAGTVRPHNEDYIGFWQPETLEEKRNRGAIAVLADGVGGQGHGEVASRLAVEEALKTFREAKGEAAPAQFQERRIPAETSNYARLRPLFAKPSLRRSPELTHPCSPKVTQAF